MKIITSIITKLNALVLTVSVLASTMAVFAAPRGQLSSGDYRYLFNAARDGMAERMAADLARHVAADPAVRALAERIVASHTQAGVELKQLAAKKGAVLPPHINTRQQRRQEYLQTLHGPEFDKAYLEGVANGHQKTLKESQKASANVRDSDVKAFADKTAATQNQHLQESKALVAGTAATVRTQNIARE